MLKRLRYTIGFRSELVSGKNVPLSIGIIDADLLDHGTRHPNLALLKISSYCKGLGHVVRLVSDYSELLGTNLNAFDLLVMSKVFTFSKIPAFVSQLIKEKKIVRGGTGFFELDCPDLPPEVEHSKPDYSLYLDYIEKQTGGDAHKKKRDYDDYLSYSIGFTTRGCFRKCSFCVNRKYNSVFKHSPVSEFLDSSRPKIYLWDDNIMASPHFNQIIDELEATGKAYQFRQGMDMRLMTDAKAERLSKAHYYGDFIFAFDHIEDAELIQKKLAIWRKHCKKSTKLYVLVAYDSQDEVDIENTFERIRILMTFGCLPYIMRYQDYSKSKYKDLYTQLARWCNQPGFFKKMSFRQYCIRNEEFHQGIQKKIVNGNYSAKLVFGQEGQPKPTFCSSYQCMIDFESKFPEIAAKYFDLRYEDIKPRI